MSIQLSEEQRHAVDIAMRSKKCVITGPPGSGKTTLIQELIRLFKKHKFKFLLCAPTGNATQRLSQVCPDVEAHVVEKILCNKPLIEQFANAAVIIDESSMLSVNTLFLLMTVLSPSKLCLVGDAKQVPCAAPHLPALNSLLQSEYIPEARLTHNFRRAGDTGSQLMQCAQNMGSEGFDVHQYLGDDSFKLVVCYSPAEMIQRVAKMYKEEPTQIITFTTDMCAKINEATVSEEPKVVGNVRKYDRVVCVKNFYEHEKLKVANGVVGVCGANAITYSNGYVDKRQGKNGRFKTLFEPCRCMTAHKTQGSEFHERGIVVLTGWHGPMPLELVYTAMTRFKKNVVVFGLPMHVNQVFREKFINRHDEVLVTVLKNLNT